MGAYSIVVEFPDTNTVSAEAIHRIATDRIRSLEQGDIQRYLRDASDLDDDDAPVLVDNDTGVDNEFGGEVLLAEDDAFPTGTRFVARNALSSADDVDRHQVQVPEGAEHATIRVYSLTPGMKTSIAVEDALGQPLPACCGSRDHGMGNEQP